MARNRSGDTLEAEGEGEVAVATEKRKATTEVFELADFPPKRVKGRPAGLAAAEQVQVAIDNPGRVFCIRQYDGAAGGQASAYAASVKKHYPEAEVRSRVLDDGRYGVLVRF